MRSIAEKLTTHSINKLPSPMHTYNTIGDTNILAKTKDKIEKWDIWEEKT